MKYKVSSSFQNVVFYVLSDDPAWVQSNLEDIKDNVYAIETENENILSAEDSVGNYVLMHGQGFLQLKPNCEGHLGLVKILK